MFLESLIYLMETSRSSHQRCSIRKGVLRNFWGLKPATLLKKLWHRCFLVNSAKFLRTPFCRKKDCFWETTETASEPLLNISYQGYNIPFRKTVNCFFSPSLTSNNTSLILEIIFQKFIALCFTKSYWSLVFILRTMFL